MDDLFQRKESACFIQMDGNFLVSFIGRKTCKLTCFLGQNAVAVNGTDDGNFGIVAADVVVVNTVSGSGMDAARTAFERNMVADNQQRLTVEEGMLCFHILQLAALNGADNLIIGFAGFLHCGLVKLGRHDVKLLTAFDDGILIARTDADRNIRGKRPCGGCPDHEGNLCGIDTHSFKLAQIVGHGELDVDGMAGILCVLNLRFREGGLTFRAPIYGLQSAIDITLVSHFGKDLDLLCLELVLEGNIRIVPFADAAQTLELLTLIVDVAGDELLTELAQLDNGNIRRAANARLLSGFQLGRQAVRIPAGNKRRLKARHVLVADDKILEDFVQRVSEVNITVCIGRSVVEHKLRLALVELHQLIIYFFTFPCFQGNRLALWQTCTHGKVGLRQIQCCVIILGHCVYLSNILV